MHLGVDTGGTFTDAVALQADGSLRLHKLPTTPRDPARAVLEAARRLAEQGQSIELDHGTTHATNALLTGELGRVTLLVTAGFRDLLAIGRQDREVVHSLEPTVARAAQPRSRILEVAERLGPRGEVVNALTQKECRRLAKAVARQRPQAVAIVLLHAWEDDRHEQQLAKVLRQSLAVPVLCSSEVAPEIREVERAQSTWAEAALMPVVQQALQSLATGLARQHPQSRLRLMRSDGGVVGLQAAAAHPLQLALSGPAAGLAAASSLAQARGDGAILTFDMGGTSTDVAWIEDELPQLESLHLGGMEFLCRGLPIHTVGTGGGSLARCDAGGGMQVGPQSAGAEPGPACYGRGGEAATVTDAHLCLGRLRADAFLGGAASLDETAARAALRRLGQAWGHEPEQAAIALLEVAQADMERALRRVSLAAGHDPRHATLYSFGGAGGLHAAWLAEALEMKRVVAPPMAGVFSAVGLLSAPLRRTASRSVWGPVPTLAARKALFAPLLATAKRELAAEGVRGRLQVQRFLDLRVLGQAGLLSLPEGPHLQARFAAAYRRRFGFFEEGSELELAAVRVVVEQSRPAPWRRQRSRRHAAKPWGQASVWHPPSLLPGAKRPFRGGDRQTALYRREELAPGATLLGPAVVVEASATTVVPPGWRATLDAWSCLCLEVVR